MKRFFNTIKNIFSIEDLRKRILYTLFIILIYRLGAHIVLPGINPADLAAFSQSAQEGLLGMLDLFSGGAFSNASIFALGIMPYISASIVIQLMTLAVPYFQRLQKEGESGRKKINQITRYLTIAVVGIQAPPYIANIVNQFGGAVNPAMLEPTFLFGISTFAITAFILLIAGTLFIMWLGERITDNGLGNGISIIIMVGIIARLPHALYAEFVSKVADMNGGPIVFIVEIVIMMVIISLCVLLVQGTRRIPVQYAKRIEGNKQYGGVRNYLPLKVNAAGVMPIIFAQALMFLPLTFMNYSAEPSKFWMSFIDYNGLGYNIVFFLLIIAFTYFYTAITINPQQIAEDLKKNNGFIPGTKPGKQTAQLIDEIMSRITLPGSIFLGIVAILPAVVRIFDVNQQFAQFFGGTSLLIMVGVVLDMLQQIESHLLMRHYDGLTKSGRIKGRTNGMY
jgi:preprotein translocase subunit SecY